MIEMYIAMGQLGAILPKLELFKQFQRIVIFKRDIFFFIFFIKIQTFTIKFVFLKI